LVPAHIALTATIYSKDYATKFALMGISEELQTACAHLAFPDAKPALTFSTPLALLASQELIYITIVMF
jgi:hypothetical protein